MRDNDRRLLYRRMLVLMGVMLGLVLLVMVGEQAQDCLSSKQEQTRDGESNS